MRHRPPMSDAEKRKVRKLRAEGLSRPVIAQRLGISLSCVSRTVAEATEPIQESTHEQSNGNSIAGRETESP